MTWVASRSRLTRPMMARGRYCEPPGQVWPPPSILYSATNESSVGNPGGEDPFGVDGILLREERDQPGDEADVVNPLSLRPDVRVSPPVVPVAIECVGVDDDDAIAVGERAEARRPLHTRSGPAAPV